MSLAKKIMQSDEFEDHEEGLESKTCEFTSELFSGLDQYLQNIKSSREEDSVRYQMEEDGEPTQTSTAEITLDMTVKSAEFSPQGASPPSSLGERREFGDGQSEDDQITEIENIPGLNKSHNHQETATFNRANDWRGSFLSLNSTVSEGKSKSKRKFTRKYLSSIGSIRVKRQLSLGGGLNHNSQEDSESDHWLPAMGW